MINLYYAEKQSTNNLEQAHKDVAAPIANTRVEILFKSTGCTVSMERPRARYSPLYLESLGRHKVQKIVFFCESGSYSLLFTLLNGFSLGHTTTAYVTCLRPNAFEALRILLFPFFQLLLSILNSDSSCRDFLLPPKKKIIKALFKCLESGDMSSVS